MAATAAPEIGQLAPDFKLKGPDGQPVTLSELRGRRSVVLVFYPLAFSRVCSHQLPAVEADLARFEALGASVFGISVDSHYANAEFARKLNLTFPLLSDFKHEASAAYGVLMPEAGYSGRAIFLIDREGRLAYRDVSSDLDLVPSNASVLEALKALS